MTSRPAAASGGSASLITSYRPAATPSFTAATAAAAAAAAATASGSAVGTAGTTRQHRYSHVDDDDPTLDGYGLGDEQQGEDGAAAGRERKRQRLSEGGGGGEAASAASGAPPPLWRSSSEPAAAAVPFDDHGALLMDEDEEDFFALLDSMHGPAEPRSLALPLPTPAAAAADASGSGANDGSWDNISFQRPPLDWNLHSRMRITSPHPFDWASSPDRRAEAEGVCAYHAATRLEQGRWGEEAPRKELHHALCYSVFPAHPFNQSNPLTGAIQAALNKQGREATQADRTSLAFLGKMWRQWEDSLTALYSRLTLPSSSPAWLDHFYLLHRAGGGGGSGGPLSYAVLFLATDPDSRFSARGPAAVVSRSNKALRAMLQAKKVQFTMPNSDAWAQLEGGGAAGAEGMGDGLEHDHSAPPSKATAMATQQRLQKQMQDEDMTAASVLLIQGRKDVHALYDTLLNQDRERRELSLPTLLASSPFINAETHAVNVVRVGPMGGQGSFGSAADLATTPTGKGWKGATAAVSSRPVEHCLELSGPLLPASVIKLLTLLQHTQHDSFTASFVSPHPLSSAHAPSSTGAAAAAAAPAAGDYSCLHLNCVPGVIQMCTLHGHPDVDALCEQRSLVRHTSVFLHGRKAIRSIGAIKRVSRQAGHYSVELTTPHAQ